MPKSYSEKERTAIMNGLRAAALESMFQKGIRKTTVDELAARVHIPKGTFYLFYEAKEMLMYDAIMQMHDKMHRSLSDDLIRMKETVTTDSLTDFLIKAFSDGFDIGILPLMISGELDMLMRKLPDKAVLAHQENDDDFFMIFKTLFPDMPAGIMNNFSAAFRALFFTAAYRREIGGNYDSALRILIRGLVMQMREAA